ncbi:MAG: hypothetical protein PVG39_24905 [Desulfobacteraceae bacterium]|jgi:hypothetical protein
MALGKIDKDTMPEDVAKAVEKVTQIAVAQLVKKGLTGLYLGGSALSPDFLPWSDIDLYGIVEDIFDLDTEQAMTQKLRDAADNVTKIPLSFHGIAMSELNGGPQKGTITSRIPLSVLIRRLPFFPLLWGLKVDFGNLPVKPCGPRGEAMYMIPRIRRDIKWIRDGKFIPRELPKQAMHLARIEAEAEHMAGYLFRFNDVLTHFADTPDHIVHSAIALRKTENLTREMVIEFCDTVEEYLAYIEPKVDTWS